MSINHYTYRVTWSAKKNEHVGLCAEFPSLSWLAPPPEKALLGIRRVVADAVADMKVTLPPKTGSLAKALKMISEEKVNHGDWYAGAVRSLCLISPGAGCGRNHTMRRASTTRSWRI